jgi:hypothetical protein
LLGAVTTFAYLSRIDFKDPHFARNTILLVVAPPLIPYAISAFLSLPRVKGKGVRVWSFVCCLVIGSVGACVVYLRVFDLPFTVFTVFLVVLLQALFFSCAAIALLDAQSERQ